MQRLMIITAIIFTMLATFTFFAWGADPLVSPAATVVWDSYADQDNISGFVLYTQAVDTEDIRSVKLTNPAATIYALNPLNYEPGKTYSLWITAFNARGESDKADADRDWTVSVFDPAENPPDVYVTIPGPVNNLQFNIVH